MDIQQYIRSHFSGKRLILVGNARFTESRSELIDSHDIVVRFNLFSRNGFEQGFCGRKFAYWFVNLNTGRKNRERRADLAKECARARQLLPVPLLFAASANDKHNRLPDAVRFFREQEFQLHHPDSHLQCPSPKEPSVGFYTACRLISENIPITIAGFTGDVSTHHEGKSEMAHLSTHPLVTLVPAV